MSKMWLCYEYFRCTRHFGNGNHSHLTVHLWHSTISYNVLHKLLNIPRGKHHMLNSLKIHSYLAVRENGKTILALHCIRCLCRSRISTQV